MCVSLLQRCFLIFLLEIIMNKADYVALAGISLFAFFIIWKQKEKQKKDKFEEEIFNLKHAVDSTIKKHSK